MERLSFAREDFGGVRVSRRYKRLIPWIALTALLVVMVLLPLEVHLAVHVSLGGLAVLAGLFLLTDHLIDFWLKRHIGAGASSPLSFARDEAPKLVAGAGLILAAFASYLALRLPIDPGQRDVLLIAAGVLVGVAVLAGVARLLVRREPARPDAVTDAVRRLRRPALLRDVREAWEFQRICGARLFGPLLALWSAALGALTVALAVLGGVFYASYIWLGPFGMGDIERWPITAKASVLLAIAVTGWVFATATLGSFRTVVRMRRVGRLKEGEVWRQTGQALETLGVWGTAMYSFILALFFALLAFGMYGAAILLEGHAAFPPAGALAAGCLVAVVAGWILCIWPQLYIYAILTRRDCGWMRAFEASLDLAMLEKRDSFWRALIATGMVLSIFAIPAAIFLLLEGVYHRELLIAAILGEKTRTEVLDALEESDRERPEFLQRFDNLLRKGRYLDALNGYQMHLMKDPHHLPALSGAARAMLHMGNPRAREYLEMWESLDPENDEAMTLLAEYRAGRWSDNGDLYQEAQRKCTQPIGRGV